MAGEAGFPAVRLDDDALDVTRRLAELHLPGLIVVDDENRPLTILPGSQVLRFLIPRYVQDDPALARVIDESHADRLRANLEGRRVADLLPAEKLPLPLADADDTALEIAALMARTRSPLVAVVEDGRLLGVVTSTGLLERLLAG
ncbi:CBS domain-containing protein [Bailinhaonella thermotolerans]|uniref:CBS domain-containing protein n=2 Tax=Bailinhaonella thermotolerans TaxID=1070861 RepID=A0A3A4A1M4_9ACTN|nr:CBS domain-containing protein [Bailinhaonella thermotolerans]